MKRTLTAPLATLQMEDGTPIGKAKNLRVSESIQRTAIKGIGQLVMDEIPAVSWQGTMTCSFFSVQFNENQADPLTGRTEGHIKNAVFRKTDSVEEWTNTILLQEDGVTVNILKKVADSTPRDGSVAIERVFETFAKVRGCFMTRESFDISDGQVSGHDQEFEYTTPIFFV
jgi:hypothetical protein